MDLQFAELICGPPSSPNLPLVSTTPAVTVGKFMVAFIPVMYLDANISANF
jgi:hypothetical protein